MIKTLLLASAMIVGAVFAVAPASAMPVGKVDGASTVSVQHVDWHHHHWHRVYHHHHWHH